MQTPTQSERADFAAFCRNVTYGQLITIEAKEREASRPVYADIAREERKKRESR